MNRNSYVPDFEYNDGSGNPASASLTRSNKSLVRDEDLMEVLCQNDQIIFQSQNQRSQRKPDIGDSIMLAELPARAPRVQIRSDEETAANLFMQEDEMTNWLQYPLDDTPFDRDLYADLLYPPNCTPASTLPARPGPVVDIQILNSEFNSLKPPTAPVHNFTHFSRYNGMADQGGPSIYNKTTANQLAIMDSGETPALGKTPEYRISHVSNSPINTIGRPNAALGIGIERNYEARTHVPPGSDFAMSSSPGVSAISACASVEPTTPKPAPPMMEDRKRKGRATADAAEDNDFNSAEVKKRARGSTSSKKSRAAAVHNLSERKRRDRINDKMKSLQNLIPNCSKTSDKSSMLDDAIEYMKTLQLQVQMMSMGCTLIPVMFPGIHQHYMPTVGMGMGMGMAHPMMQFPPHVYPGSSVQGQSSMSHMASQFSTPTSFPFPGPPPGAAIPDSNIIQATNHTGSVMNTAAIPDSNRIQATNLPDSVMNSSSIPDSNRIQATNFPGSVMNSTANQNHSHPQMQNAVFDPYQYQQYINMNQSWVSRAQNPTVRQPNASESGVNASESGVGNNGNGNLQSG